jgi:hypothetical protein
MAFTGNGIEGNPGGWEAMRYMITDEMWAVIEECLAKAKIEKRGRPAEISDRKFLEAGLALPGANGDSLAGFAQEIWEMGCD